MTKEEILQLEGRALDKAVAIHVMGYEVDKRSGFVKRESHATIPRRYSEDISAAWEVVEELNGKFSFTIQRLGDYFDEGPEWEGWEAIFGAYSDRRVKAKTAPLAICRAALLAIKGE